MIDRLKLVDASLPDRLSAAGPEAQRALARAVALSSADHTGLDHEGLESVLSRLRAGSTEVPDLVAANAAVAELDNAAFDARDRLEEGTGSEADYVRMFSKARAATAVFADDPSEAAEDAIHEAYHATGENMDLLRDSINRALA